MKGRKRVFGEISRSCNRCYSTRALASSRLPIWATSTSSIAKSSTNPTHQLLSRQWIRGAKRTTKILAKDIELPQGPLPAKPDEIIEESDGPAYPTVVQQARNNMRKFSHCVVLTRVGSFYEVKHSAESRVQMTNISCQLYFEQAEEYAPLLNLKAATKKTNAGPVPMVGNLLYAYFVSTLTRFQAGFPYFQLDRFLKILVQDLGKYVAISEEFANDAAGKVKSGGLLFDRRVTRIITPGTLIDEKFMDPCENNYLLSIHAESEVDKVLQSEDELGEHREPPAVGLAWVDLSSGDFNTQKTDLDSLSSIVARIGPREIIIDQALESLEDSPLVSMLKEESHVITFHKPPKLVTSPADWLVDLEDVGPDFDPSKFSEAEVVAGAFLSHYLITQLQGKKARLQAPMQRHEDEYMRIDKHSVKALEIKSTLAENEFVGSLLHSVRKTVTKSGTRLLSKRLTSPSASLEEINERLDLVTEMIENQVLRQDLISLLKRTFDSLRLVQKFSFGRGDADDLLGLSRTIQVAVDIARLLNDHVTAMIGPPEVTTSSSPQSRNGHECIKKLTSRLNLEGPTALSERILNAIDEDMLSEQHRLEDSEAARSVELTEEVIAHAGEDTLKGVPRGVKSKVGEDTTKNGSPESEVWIMRKNASRTLRRLHGELDDLIQQKTELETELKAKAAAKSLTLRWTPGMGHHVHLRGRDTNLSTLSTLGATRTIGSSKSTRSFHLAEWTALGTRIDEAKIRIRAEEHRVFASLRDAVIKNLVQLRRNARVLDELDVACAFAVVAAERRWTRPIMNYGTKSHIVGGRHPMVEVGLTRQGRQFTSNDCMVGVSSFTPSNNPSPSPSPPTVPNSSPPSPEEQILLITGPNMAGKSTYLRQNALISILAQSGSYVPAAHCTLGIVDAIFSRVGSADNLYLSQSTFMLEMLETAHILRHASRRSFVIMDEVGRGTTPEDGIAVSYASLWYLYNRIGCRSLFATHFHKLVDMVGEWRGVGCWCTDVVEDVEDRESATVKGWAYVHKLRRGANRRSHALKVARMAGLPAEAVEVARRVLEQLQLEERLHEPPKLAAGGLGG
jgi:DNA mismatch repair ATPase MutS